MNEIKSDHKIIDILKILKEIEILSYKLKDIENSFKIELIISNDFKDIQNHYIKQLLKSDLLKMEEIKEEKIEEMEDTIKNLANLLGGEQVLEASENNQDSIFNFGAKIFKGASLTQNALKKNEKLSFEIKKKV